MSAAPQGYHTNIIAKRLPEQESCNYEASEMVQPDALETRLKANLMPFDLLKVCNIATKPQFCSTMICNSKQ
eukprot:3825503-Amphidinium_carterae.1